MSRIQTCSLGVSEGKTVCALDCAVTVMDKTGYLPHKHLYIGCHNSAVYVQYLDFDI
jgi:hypothetical protein